ncbi:hypothetical protein BDY24DRAFT_184518 [Mrakia frigida]|uniref:uncharacterized protein n=1 Tax=Mrakia frigida TaxID=29902 RepID=UPI003FCBF7F7
MPFSPKRSSFPTASASSSFSSFLLPSSSSSSSSTSLLAPTPPPQEEEEPFSPRGIDDYDENWQKGGSLLVGAKEEVEGTDLDEERAEAVRRRRRGEPDDDDEESGRWPGTGRRRSSITERFRFSFRGCRLIGGGLKGGGRRRSTLLLFCLVLVGGLLWWNESLGLLRGREVEVLDTRLLPWSHPERDTIIFYTILGSDLPPRHSPNQTLVNLSFMLSNENLTFPSSSFLPHTYLPPTLKIERKFLLNRLVPGPERTALVDLLERNGKTWEEVEWKDEAWRQVGFRCE